MMMENAASIKATFSRGNHGHLGLVITPARYMQVTGVPFNQPPNPGPIPVMPRLYMAAVDAEMIRHYHQLAVIQYHTFCNTNKVLQAQITGVIDQRYTKTL
eukprot:9126099-Ditylum_brightwellii.AAC.1